MEHLLIVDSLGKIIVSRFDPACRKNCFEQASDQIETCGVGGVGRRRRCITSVGGATVFLCTDDEDALASKKKFRQRLVSYTEMLAAFQNVRDDTVARLEADNRRLVHNLTTLNSHILQEVYSISSQEKLHGDAQQQIEAIRKEILVDPSRAASAALRILKSAVAARTEMQIVRWLHPSENPPEIKPKFHVWHRVVKNALVTFFQDSQEKKLTWRLGNSLEKILFDYETFSAALYRLFENVIKYCQSGTTVHISLNRAGRNFAMSIEMTSLWIGLDESERIFEEGYSGQEAKLHSLHGDGLGLHFVREMLRLNQAHVRWEPAQPVNIRIDDRFGINRFIIEFAPGSST